MERFWSGSSINKNKALVEQLQNYGTISSKKVSEVMETIDRALFVPDGTPAYVDSPIAIGYNATISAPHMHATCLQLLEENLKWHACPGCWLRDWVLDSMLCSDGWTTRSCCWCRTYSRAGWFFHKEYQEKRSSSIVERRFPLNSCW
uniref:Uncharacterized protein n=1 Tax=Populus trichocarpa TaxID=3694 RepID=A9PDR3_POPTR|nr:unknown [Populus trichocarpa]